jgi:hypothetical protein
MRTRKLIQRHGRRAVGRYSKLVRERPVEFVMGDFAVLVGVELGKKSIGETAARCVGLGIEALVGLCGRHLSLARSSDGYAGTHRKRGAQQQGISNCRFH